MIVLERIIRDAVEITSFAREMGLDVSEEYTSELIDAFIKIERRKHRSKNTTRNDLNLN